MRWPAWAGDNTLTMSRSVRKGRRPPSEWGFTLVEMTVVIAIIVIIASMALPNVRGLVFQGRGAGKAADLREMTTAAARHLQEFRAPPTVSGGWPPVKARDVDGDGAIRIALDTANDDGQGALPENIDVICTTDSTSLADALARCLLAVDFAKVDAYLMSFPEHAGEDVTEHGGVPATYDDDQATVDIFATSVNVGGDDLAIYVKDGGSVLGTPFPAGALAVWSMADGSVWAIKSDDIYGRE